MRGLVAGRIMVWDGCSEKLYSRDKQTEHREELHNGQEWWRYI
jgi:hypothetical protein